MNKDLFSQLVNSGQVATALLLIAVALWGIFFYLGRSPKSSSRASKARR
jgi:hypothetical protein